MVQKHGKRMTAPWSSVSFVGKGIGGLLKHKGYMGIWDKGTHFVVDLDGVVLAR